MPVVFVTTTVMDAQLEHEIFAFVRTALICQWRTFVKSNRNGGMFKGDDKSRLCHCRLKS